MSQDRRHPDDIAAEQAYLEELRSHQPTGITPAAPNAGEQMPAPGAIPPAPSPGTASGMLAGPANFPIKGSIINFKGPRGKEKLVFFIANALVSIVVALAMQIPFGPLGMILLAYALNQDTPWLKWSCLGCNTLALLLGVIGLIVFAAGGVPEQPAYLHWFDLLEFPLSIWLISILWRDIQELQQAR